jgi:hypothetical protein
MECHLVQNIYPSMIHKEIKTCHIHLNSFQTFHQTWVLVMLKQNKQTPWP